MKALTNGAESGHTNFPDGRIANKIQYSNIKPIQITENARKAFFLMELSQ